MKVNRLNVLYYKAVNTNTESDKDESTEEQTIVNLESMIKLWKVFQHMKKNKKNKTMHKRQDTYGG